MTYLTRDQIRSVDRLAIEQFGVPGVVLMENAGRGAADAICDLLREGRVELTKARAAIICGGGNNGGDGYVIARHLHNRGVAVTIDAVKNPGDLKGDAAINHCICANLGLDIRRVLESAPLEQAAGEWKAAHVIVDAMLGTGFRGEVREPMANIIGRINEMDRSSGWPRVVAVDVPSGLDCETGQAAGVVVRADLTVTFVAEKTDFQTPEARACLGRVVVADIGILARDVLGQQAS